MPRVLLATCMDLPEGDEDGELLLAALAERDITASWQAWDAPDADFSRALVIIRSTWNYTSHRDEFVAWAHQQPRLENPARVIDWNSDKAYLRDLARSDVPTVPTQWVYPGATYELPVDGEYVVKPSIGAGSRGAGRFSCADAAAAHAHIRVLHEAGRTVMIQPYLPSVDTIGETALIYFDGVFSHSVTKGALLEPSTANGLELNSGHSTALYVPQHVAEHRATSAELAVGAQTISQMHHRLGTDLLYARVDLLSSADGPVLGELELTEPSLYLRYEPAAARRFATAIASHL